MESLQRIIEILDLEEIELNHYRATRPNEGWQRVYGGQVIGQALKITIDPDTRMFYDDKGRVRMFHGLNVVYKKSPYYPADGDYDFEFSLNDDDIADIFNWGADRAACTPELGVSGWRCSTPCAATISSIASERVTLSTTWASLRAAMLPMLT